MTAYYCAVTIHCGHGWDRDRRIKGCSRTAYVECGRGMAEQLLQHETEWFCHEHKDEQTDDLSGLEFKER